MNDEWQMNVSTFPCCQSSLPEIHSTRSDSHVNLCSIPSCLDLWGACSATKTTRRITSLDIYMREREIKKNAAANSVICILPAAHSGSLFMSEAPLGAFFAVTGWGNGIRSGFYAFSGTLCQRNVKNKSFRAPSWRLEHSIFFTSPPLPPPPLTPMPKEKVRRVFFSPLPFGGRWWVVSEANSQRLHINKNRWVIRESTWKPIWKLTNDQSSSVTQPR